MSSKGRKGSRFDRDGGRDARRDVRDRGSSRRERGDRDTGRDRDRDRGSKSNKGREGGLPPFPKQRAYSKGGSFSRREQSSSRFDGGAVGYVPDRRVSVNCCIPTFIRTKSE